MRARRCVQHFKLASSTGMHAFRPHETVIFLGENTSPESPGYVTIVENVLERFHPDLHLKLISAGARGQTAAGVKSRALMPLLTSSRPNWLVLALGVTEAAREPASRKLLEAYAERQRSADSGLDAAFGPAFMADQVDSVEGGVEDLLAPSELESLPQFADDLRSVLAELVEAGVRPVLMTPAVPFMDFPLLPVFKHYSRAVRAAGIEAEVPVVDVERAFMDMIDRAANYKQRVVLAEPSGALNMKGQTLVARTFLSKLGLLP